MITLYPAIDLQGGRAVRLRQGDFAQSTVFSDSPVDQAREFAESGATSLHVVDLDGARAGEPVHAALVASIAAAFPGTVHLGGGLRSRAAIETALATGVDRVVVGTAVVDDRELLTWAIDRLGDGLVVALDARQGKVATHGWTQVSDRDAVEVATGPRVAGRAAAGLHRHQPRRHPRRAQPQRDAPPGRGRAAAAPDRLRAGSPPWTTCAACATWGCPPSTG